MESTNNNSNQMFLCEFKEIRKELSAMKKRIVQLEESHEKQQEKINNLERENHSLKKKTQPNNLNGNKEGECILKRKRTEQDSKEEKESKSTSASTAAGKKKAKTNTNNNNDDDDEAVVLPLRDNGDSFDSLSDDLLHKIVEFDGNCYSKFGLINKRCKNIYDMEEYKLKKQTCLYGYGTLDMMLERYLQKRKNDELGFDELATITQAVIFYNRFDAIDWIIQLGDVDLLIVLCSTAACYGRIDILSKVFLKLNLTIVDQLLNDTSLCFAASKYGEFKTLKWLRKYGAELSASTFAVAIRKGHDKIVQYLRLEGCSESPENSDETSENSDESTVYSDEEEGDS